MNVRKLPSGSYFVRRMIDGVTYSATFDHRPTKYEIEDAINQQRNGTNVKGTFKELAEDYISIKKGVLSPSTINAYNSIVRNISPAFLGLPARKITKSDVQREVSLYSQTHSPKSTRNLSGFISAVLYEYIPDIKLSTTLPQKEVKDIYIPTDEEVQMIIKEVKGTDYEAVTLLAIYGLRRSEALAITSSDLDGNILTINKALVKNPDGDFVIKQTKNVSSTRKIWIPDYLADLIRERGYVYNGFPNNVLRNLNRVQDKLGIPRFKYHALRHYYVSMAHALGIPDASIAATVGHVNTNTTRAIYLHAQSDKQISLQQKASEALIKE